jgi:hypothetical protein
MNTVIWAVVALIWIVSGYLIIKLDHEMFPKPVIRGVDEMLLGITILTGPLGYLIMYCVDRDIKSWKKRP